MSDQAFKAAKLRARAVFPEEMCGFIVNDEFVPVENVAADPATHVEESCGCRLCSFKISDDDTVRYLPVAQMILHSHPRGPLHPSKNDMQGQFDTDLPWGVVALDEDRMGEFEVWGDGLPIAPLLNREFMHGIRDCYSLVRDTFRSGKEKLKQDGITDQWPFDPIHLIDMARDDGWWSGDDDFYAQHFEKAGFKEIAREEARPGDCFLMRIRSEKLNHAGMLISNDLIMHQLPMRMSRREPSGIWARAAERWLRYVGVTA